MKWNILVYIALFLLISCNPTQTREKAPAKKHVNTGSIMIRCEPDDTKCLARLNQPSTDVATNPAYNGQICQANRNAKVELQKTFIPAGVDLSCKTDTDCVFDVAGRHMGVGVIMNEVTAEKRASGQKSYEASADYQKLQREYFDEHCGDALANEMPPVMQGAQVMPERQLARCIQNTCQAFSVRSCQVQDLCIQYEVPNSTSPTSSVASVMPLCSPSASTDTNTSADTNTSTNASEDLSMPPSITWFPCNPMGSIGSCQFASLGVGDYSYTVFYYDKAYTLGSAQSACQAGDGKHINGTWQMPQAIQLPQ